MRVRSIDIFRGIAIVLMVFFGIYAVLSSTPDFLQHNKPNSVHLGDFVLPMFLFASGMSLVFFAKKREKESKLNYALDCANRITQLVLISLLITLLTGRFLQMEEVMLNALLFVPSLLLIILALPELAIAAIALLIFALYFSLSASGMLPDFSATYLGGYPAALFYLPVMLGGVIAGKRILEGKSTNSLLFASAIVFLALFLLSPPYKTDVSPSFMALAIFLSLILFGAVEVLLAKSQSAISSFFEYLGRNPIRYWLMLFLFFLIPISFYAFASGKHLPLELGAAESFLTLIFCVILLFVISKVVDSLFLKLAERKK
ncbi:MAG: heparan-alpha-glucosaminide N-acetyltransferase domain-containing protein [Candidatus Micrarchaeota archaeon]|nr:heparan-alpha-glucosaminide N-acetyltransferase domain-containing protein [Candidatus Micrarchaeota archaeon]